MVALTTNDERELPPGIVRSKPKTTGAEESGPLPPAPSPEREGGAYLTEEDTSRKPRRNFQVSTFAESEPIQAPPSLSGEGAGGRGPSRITAIEAQQKRKNRVSVYIDGTFAAGLFDTVAHDLGLRVGQEITPERLEEIARAETLRRAKEDAYNFLSFRARSEKEIADKLTQKEYEPDVIAKVTEHLRGAGLLDDEAFAQNWVNARGKTRGNRMLAHELRQKGVAQDVAAQTLTERGETDAEHTAAYQAAMKKVGQRPVDTSREARAKVAAHLARRGFGWDVVKPVLARLYENKEDESETEEISDSAE